jgi:hypothetical protein
MQFYSYLETIKFYFPLEGTQGVRHDGPTQRGRHQTFSFGTRREQYGHGKHCETEVRPTKAVVRPDLPSKASENCQHTKVQMSSVPAECKHFPFFVRELVVRCVVRQLSWLEKILQGCAKRFRSQDNSTSMQARGAP